MRQSLIIISILLYLFTAKAFSGKPINSEKKAETKLGQTKKKSQARPLLSSLTSDSPFRKGFQRILNSDTTVSKLAISKAFVFLDKNHKNLQQENLCFAKTNTKNKEKIRNLNCLIVADYSEEKITPRLLFVNPQTGDYEIFLTAHGKGSNQPSERETGLKAARYSNVSGSNMTSLGFYLTDFLITSKKNTFGPGPNNGLMLDGISCTNSNARQRQIVAHTAMYVPNIDNTSAATPKVGNSEGCVTFPSTRKDVLKKCEHGALVYAYDNPKKHLADYKKD